MLVLVVRPTPGQSQWSWISPLPNSEDARLGCGLSHLSAVRKHLGFYSSPCTGGPFGELFVCFIHVRKSVRTSPSLAAFLYNRDHLRSSIPTRAVSTINSSYRDPDYDDS
jgi:hypothetical protein